MQLRAFAPLFVLAGALGAQHVLPPQTQGASGLELALRRLETNGTFLLTNAHPDDEPNALIAMLARGMGVRVVQLTATRGEGGQNDLGPETGRPLSVLRTEELLAAHAIDGAEQLFARAVDFGYSFSVEETFEKWGKDVILADFVRVIRMVRPDVILSMTPDGGGGGQHHQASARITREAFDAAADPRRFPEHAAAGLAPWKAGRLYVPLHVPAESAPAPKPGDVTLDADRFDPALAATWNEVGTLARSMHKTQGMARLLALPGPAVMRFRLAAGDVPAAADAPFGGFPEAPAPLRDGARAAREAMRTGGPAAAVAPLLVALRHVREMRAASSADPCLAAKESQILDALEIAAAIRFEALADDGVVTPGQEVTVTVHFANRLADRVAFERVVLDGFDAAVGGCATRPSGAVAPGGLVTCASKVRVPGDARITSAHWSRVRNTEQSAFDADVPFGAPFRPSPFRARVHVRFDGEPVVFESAVEFRDGSDPLAGEKRHEVLVVPMKDGERAVQRLEYAHLRRRHLHPALAPDSRPVDAKIALPLEVGVVASIADRVEGAVRRLGATPSLLDAGLLRDGDLSRYAVILVAARAFELNPEIRREARRLVDYVALGGTLIVLYQRSGLDEHGAAPYPGKVGGERATDECGPVTVLVPEHPVFHEPNRIGLEDWGGWVCERGRSFFETKDARYTDLIEIVESFEFNRGAKRGALVEARHGKGRFVYVGLALSRQLDEGIAGAYRLLANLLSLRGS